MSLTELVGFANVKLYVISYNCISTLWVELTTLCSYCERVDRQETGSSIKLGLQMSNDTLYHTLALPDYR